MLDLFIDITVFGALIMAGTYFFVFYAIRKGKTTPLYFGAFVLFTGIIILLRNSIIIDEINVTLSLKTIKSFENAFFSLAVVFFTQYTLLLYEKYVKKKIVLTTVVLFSLLAIVTFLLHEKHLLLFNNVIRLLFICLIIYLTLCLRKAFKDNKVGCEIFIIANIVLIISLLNDFLFINEIITTFEVFPIAVFIYVLLQAVFISIKNRQVSTEKKKLSSELDYHNKNLEKIIEDKTKDNERIKGEMNDQQDFLDDLKHQLDEKKEDLQAQSEMLDTVNQALDKERKKSESLLLNILPEKVAYELKAQGKAKPMHYPEASVLFTDFVGFSRIAAGLSPEELLNELHFFFVRFDDIIEKYNVDKIKTIGDAYLCASGIMDKPGNRVAACVMTGLEICRFMVDTLEEKKALKQPCFEVRIGIHTGPVVSGIVGKTKFAFDIWGDTVNTAKRIEAACNPGELYISKDTFERVKDYFICSSRGKIPVKHKGKLEVFFVERLKPEYCSDPDGFVPNNEFYKVIEGK